MALEIFKLVGSIFIDSEKADKSIGDTDKKAQGMGNTLLKGIGTAAKWAAGITAAAGGMAVAAGAAINKVAEDTREYRNDMSKLNTAFQVSGKSSSDATNTYKTLQSVLGDSAVAVEASNHLAKLCNSTEELNKWTDICTGVYATFGDSLPIEGLTEAANETAKVGQVTGNLADALNWVGISEDKFNEKLAKCKNEQERTALITETMTKTYNKASDQFKETNKDIIESNATQEKLTETTAKLGAIAEPIVNKVKNKFAELLTKIIPVATYISGKFTPAIEFLKEVIATIQDSYLVFIYPELDALKSAFNMLADAILPFINKIINLLPKMTNEFGDTYDIWDLLYDIGMKVGDTIIFVTGCIEKISIFISEHTTLVETLIIILASFATAWGLVTAAVTVWNTIATIATAITTGLSAAIAFLTSPIGIAIAIIGALIAIGVLLYKNWDTIKTYAHKLASEVNTRFEIIKNIVTTVIKNIIENIANFVDGVKSKISDIKNSISEHLSLIKSYVSNAMANVVDTVSNKISSVKGTIKGIPDYFKTKFTQAWTNVKNVFSNWTSFFSGLWDKIKNTFSKLGTSLADAIGGSIKAGINGVLTMIENTINKAVGMINNAMDAINKIPGVDIGNIDEINLPKLASGHVAYEPLVAQVGEYAGARNNPEIISPESKMREVFSDVINGTLNQLLNEIKNLSDNMKLATNSGDIVLYNYLGNELLEESIIKAQNKIKFKTGGRA